MCDYSLELYRSCPAAQEEQYTLRRFPSGTKGFMAARDCETAVCIPADAHLHLEGIAEAVKQTYAVGPVEDVVMTRMDSTAFAHRDAARFANGREALLQSLNAGIAATVLDFLPVTEETPKVQARRSPADLVDA